MTDDAWQSTDEPQSTVGNERVRHTRSYTLCQEEADPQTLSSSYQVLWVAGRRNNCLVGKKSYRRIKQCVETR